MARFELKGHRQGVVPWGPEHPTHRGHKQATLPRPQPIRAAPSHWLVGCPRVASQRRARGPDVPSATSEQESAF